jgi:peroxiredoxin Q/BCP
MMMNRVSNVISLLVFILISSEMFREKNLCKVYSFEQTMPNLAFNKKSELFSRRSFVQISSAAAASTLIITQQSKAAVGAIIPSTNLPVIGAKAPSFQLPNSRGTGKTSLDDLLASKKWTVLYFYPGAFSQGCTLEARGFQRDIEKYRALNAQIVGVSVDSVEKNAEFCATEGLDFFMLTDEGGAVSKDYGSGLSVPGFGTFSGRNTYLIDPSGALRWVFTDVENRIPKHSAEVLDKLSELAKSS